ETLLNSLHSNMKEVRYKTDLTDKQWAILKKAIPPVFGDN
ncbi:MAG: hypothetical protein ACJA04_000468, partial [Cellvibrionaceae bacterium]